METLFRPGLLKQKDFRFIWELQRYFFKFVLFLAFVSQVIEVVIYPEIRLTISILVPVILEMSAFLSVFRFRQKIHQLLKKVSDCSRALGLIEEKQKFRISIIIYCSIMMILTACYLLLHFNSKKRAFMINMMIKSSFFSFQLQEYLSIFLDVNVSVVIITQSLVLISLSGYYGFVCFYLRFLLRKLEQYARNASGDRYQHIIHTYLKIIHTVKFLEDYLCFSAFATVVSSMSGLFYANYSLLFASIGDLQHFLALLSGEIFFSTFIVMIIVPASAVNDALLSTKKALIFLTRIRPQHFNEVTLIISSEEVSLTLWKIYKIRKSLIISALGTLLSYGILVATLDTMKNPRVI
ncbi:uncharacterized protein NPIL_637241 [Nephila pilipes]|uniref:Gustatory receptor n=1 Tax=Nephila pilipes TaxID=299642 RepID=A0A8X6T3T8_NEPPI|nr:uncharacterized protein NPIL_637241 [Nephila pilipes]